MTTTMDTPENCGDRSCSQCGQRLTQVGAFWICPTHGQQSESRPITPLRIFLSYGHDANEELVLRIKADLENRGHDLWFDKSEIKFGDDWRRSISDGIVGSHRVLSFLSKHSTRDPGVCRDEIAIAIGVKGGNIQPILVESEQEVQPPVNISHIQWLDMHNWKEMKASGGTVWEDWYLAKLAEIIRVIESDEGRFFAGEIESLNGYLKPIKSDARIYELLRKGFYGRHWLFEAVEKWRLDPKRDSRLFWIMGAPGVGKSAIAAQLTHMRGDTVIAAQFCEWDKPDHRNAQRVIRSLAFQLATRLPDYRKLLLALPEIGELDKKDATELFDYLIANPLRLVINGGRQHYLIVIDALDEAGEAGRNPLVELLARNAQRLPDWLGLVVTSRPEFDVKTLLQALSPFPLDTESESNRADIREYIQQELSLQLQNRPDADRLLEQILEKSEGIFLYVEWFCDDVRNCHLSLDRPEQFPQGLGGIFYQYFQRLFPDLEKFHQDVRTVLRVILAAREPLTFEILQRLFNWRDEELRDFIRPLASLFPVSTEAGHNVIKPYHKSLADWLAEESTAGAYFVSIPEGHRMLADYFRKQADPAMNGTWRVVNTQALKELPHHQASGQMWTELETTLCNLSFVDAKCAAGMTYDLIHDYEEILRLAGVQSSLPKIKEYSQFLSVQAHNFARFASTSGYVYQQAFNEGAGSVFEAARRRTEDQSACGTTWLHLVNRIEKPSFDRGLKRTLLQGDKAVRAVAITPNGTHAVSGGDDRIVRLWSLHDGVSLGELATHEAMVTAVSINDLGTVVASGDSRGRVVVWAPSQGAWFELPSRRSEVMAIGLEGQHLAVCYEDGCVRLWRQTPIELEVEFATQVADEKVTAAAFSPDLTRIAVGFEDGTIAGWSCLNPVPVQRTFHVRHEDEDWRHWHRETRVKDERLPPGLRGRKVCGLCLSAQGNRMFSGGDSDEVILWDLASNPPEAILVFKTDGWSQAVACDREGQVAVNGSPLGILRILDAGARAVTKTCKAHGDWVVSVALAEDASVAVSAGLDGSIKVWSPHDHWEPPATELPDRDIDCIALTADGRTVLMGAYAPALRGSVYVWDVEAGIHIHSLEGGMCADTISMSPDESMVGAVGTNAIPHVWLLGTGTEIVHRKGGGTGTPMEFSPDDAAIVTGGTCFEEAAEIWHVPSGKTLSILSDPSAKEYFRQVRFCPDGRSLVAIAGNGALLIIDGPTGRRCATIPGYWKLALPSPDSRSLLGIASDGTLSVFVDFQLDNPVWRSSPTVKYTTAVWSRNGTEILALRSTGFLEAIRPSGRAPNVAIQTDGTDLRLSCDGLLVAILGQEHWLAIYRLIEHDLVARFTTDTKISSISEFTPAGRIALGEGNGHFRVLQIEGAPMDLPITTAAYFWDWEQGDWVKQPQIRCPCCRARFVPANAMLESVQHATDLLTTCSNCGVMLRLNPFIVDTRDQYGQ